jgi:hypothetical protein
MRRVGAAQPDALRAAALEAVRVAAVPTGQQVAHAHDLVGVPRPRQQRVENDRGRRNVHEQGGKPAVAAAVQHPDRRVLAEPRLGHDIFALAVPVDIPIENAARPQVVLGPEETDLAHVCTHFYRLTVEHGRQAHARIKNALDGTGEGQEAARARRRLFVGRPILQQRCPGRGRIARLLVNGAEACCQAGGRATCRFRFRQRAQRLFLPSQQGLDLPGP